MPVILNAWESDYCGDPLLAILASLLKAVNSWEGDAEASDIEALKEAAKDVAWFATGLANEFLAKWTGINAVRAGQLAEDKREARADVIPDFVKLFHQRTDALRNLKERLAAVFGGESPKIFVFVDELDRCRPDYAVSYLETIKHVFDVRGMVFILAIDYEHLAGSAKALFGQDLNFKEYFRKFCHRVIPFPDIHKRGQLNLASEYVKKYLEIEGKRICGINLRDRTKDTVELAVGLHMRPRQLQEAFRIIGHVCAVENPNHRANLLWCLGASAILLAFLRVTREETYFRIKDNKLRPEDFGQFLISIVGKAKAEWWFKIYLTGLPRKATEESSPETILVNAGFLKTGDAFNSSQELGQFYQGWGMSGDSNLADIFRCIETVDSFQ